MPISYDLTYDIEGEVWKPTVGFEGWYEVSDQGRVRRIKPAKSIRVPHILTPKPAGKIERGEQSLSVCLSINGKKFYKYIHHLVLNAFVGPCPDNMEGCHKDDDKKNNKLSNLYWGTHLENCKDRDRNGKQVKGEKSGTSKLTEKQVLEIREDPRSLSKIAKDYNVGFQHVSRIKHRENWGWLK